MRWYRNHHCLHLHPALISKLFFKHELSVVAHSLDLKQPVGRVFLHTLFSHSSICTHLFHPHSYFSPVGHEPICYILFYNSHPLLDLPMLGASQLLPFNSKPVASVNLFCRRQEEPEPDWEIHRRLETWSQNLKTQCRERERNWPIEKKGRVETDKLIVLIGKSTVNCQLYSQLKIPQKVGTPFVQKSVTFTDTRWCQNPGKITYPPEVVIAMIIT